MHSYRNKSLRHIFHFALSLFSDAIKLLFVDKELNPHFISAIDVNIRRLVSGPHRAKETYDKFLLKSSYVRYPSNDSASVNHDKSVVQW